MRYAWVSSKDGIVKGGGGLAIVKDNKFKDFFSSLNVEENWNLMVMVIMV